MDVATVISSPGRSMAAAAVPAAADRPGYRRSPSQPRHPAVDGADELQQQQDHDQHADHQDGDLAPPA